MAKKKHSQDYKDTDLVSQMVDELFQRMQEGEKVGLNSIVQGLLNGVMKRERERFLLEHPEQVANGFYHRALHLSIGKLNLRVPRVRFGATFRPVLLPQRWQRVNKEYEELLIAMLSNDKEPFSLL